MENKLRKYDKDIYLSAFIMLAETLTDEIRTNISKDILVEIPKAIDRDIEKFMELITTQDPAKMNRWYDKNPSLRAVIMGIKELTDEERANLYDSIDTIIKSHVGLDKEAE